MRNRLLFPFSMLLLFSACGGNAPELSFQGTWTCTREDGLSSDKEQSAVAVKAHNAQFQIITKNAEGETTDAYDGKTLRHRTTFTDPERSPVLSEKSQTDIGAEPLRFWNRSFTGSGVGGGTIAGRPVTLYQFQENRPDNQVTVQAWVDSETNVMLKRIYTLYSFQMQMMTKRETDECTDIRYAPMDPAVFSTLP